MKSGVLNGHKCPFCGKEALQNIYQRGKRWYVEYHHDKKRCYFGEITGVIVGFSNLIEGCGKIVM